MNTIYEEQMQHMYAEAAVDDNNNLTIYAMGGFMPPTRKEWDKAGNLLYRRHLSKKEIEDYDVLRVLEDSYRLSLLIKMNDFLVVLRTTYCNIKKASSMSGLNRSVADDLRVRVPDFDRLWKEAHEDATDDLESAAFTRAVEGVTEDIFWRGEVVGVKTTYSDGLLSMMLQGRRPDKYKQRVSQELSGGDTPIKVNSDMSKDSIIAELERRGLPTSIYQNN